MFSCIMCYFSVLALDFKDLSEPAYFYITPFYTVELNQMS